MSIATFTKDPDAVLDYQIDWTAWLTGGETITTSTWTLPTGITRNSDNHTTTMTTIWLSGGTAGTKYALVNRIVTSAARTDDRTITISVKER